MKSASEKLEFWRQQLINPDWYIRQDLRNI